LTTLSVVIPTYNHGPFVTEAVKSVLAQTRLPNEIVVVDDGSTDDTANRLQPFMDRIIYIHQENRGLAAARNTGIFASQSDWVAFLDADDIWYEGKVEQQLDQIASADPSVGCVYTRFVIDAGDYRILSQLPPRQGNLTLRDLIRKNWVGVLTTAVRRDLLLEIGAFDEELSATEDWDLWLRLAAAHIGFEYLPIPLAQYHLSMSSMHADPGRMERNAEKVVDKLFSRSDLPRNVRGLKHFALSHFCLQLSWYAVAVGQRAQSIQYFRKAARLWPGVMLGPEAIGVVLRLGMGDTLYDFFRSTRRFTGAPRTKAK
jgi:glycosyltransferase involved in cell wall biosynthesis